MSGESTSHTLDARDLDVVQELRLENCNDITTGQKKSYPFPVTVSSSATPANVAECTLDEIKTITVQPHD